MSKSKVTVLGGTGFVGTQLVYRLAQRFDKVVLLSRHNQRSRTLRILPNVFVEKADVHDPKQLESAFNGTDVVVNLIGILNQGGKKAGNSFVGAHATLTENVIKACEQQGVAHYLHMSSLNADAKKGSSEYLRSKGMAEDAVQASTALAWTIFQPSVIFGEKDSFFNRFNALLNAIPIFPLACPDAKMAPVYVGDVVDCMMNALDNSDAVGSRIQLCGPADYTLQELVEFTANTSRLKRKIVRLPDGLARLQARVMEWVPGKPFSRDNYLSLQTDSICTGGCERQPTSIQAVVPGYLGRSTGLSGRHQSRRELARR